MNTIQSVPSSSHQQPAEATEDVPLRERAAPVTGISDDDDRSNSLNEAPILAACRNNNLIWLRELLTEDPGLAQGTAPSGMSKHPVSPLHITAQGGYVDATKCLLDTALQGVPEAEKADVTIKLMTIRHNLKKDAATPFYLAAKNANGYVVATFLKYLLALPEADIPRALVAVMNAALKEGQTPLCEAIKRGDDLIVHCFMDALKLSPEAKRADTMIQVLAPEKQGKGKGNRLPLHLAAGMRNSLIVKLILDAVSEIPAPDRSKVVRQVVNATDAYGATPLFIAVQGGFARIVQQILAIISEVPESERAEVGNALVNTANKDGATPLYAAASSKCSTYPIVSTLLKHGADPELAKTRCVPGRCRRSNSPRQVARQRGDRGTVALIDKAIQSRKSANLQSAEEPTAAL
ncbi:ankyrin repeat domain-containing protein [Endozoicomonas sp. YOMI1]|uniref:ankyrin repeat domain-containing protein n=1 Tax=Endozoicomonas sp. YOMI1 TaxID=2828739 RepID=UPI0021492F9E|nr:ankyrin repeat domain-containing protein [Endozoicomonas sp. YOMI1]